MAYMHKKDAFVCLKNNYFPALKKIQPIRHTIYL